MYHIPFLDVKWLIQNIPYISYKRLDDIDITKFLIVISCHMIIDSEIMWLSLNCTPLYPFTNY